MKDSVGQEVVAGDSVVYVKPQYQGRNLGVGTVHHVTQFSIVITIADVSVNGGPIKKVNLTRQPRQVVRVPPITEKESWLQN